MSGTSQNPGTSDNGHRKPRRLAVWIIALCAAALVAFSAWSLVEYQQGRDPLAFLGGSDALSTTDEAAAGGSSSAGNDASADSTAAGSPSAGDGGTSSDASSGDSTSAPAQTDAGSASSSSGTQSPATPTSDSQNGGQSQNTSSNASSGAASQQASSSLSIPVTIDASPAGGTSSSMTVSVAEGSTVYDALRATGASLNASDTVYGIYVASINGLAEKEHGPMSGWVYAVNGVEPNTACSNYVLKAGDVVTWTYVNVES